MKSENHTPGKWVAQKDPDGAENDWVVGIEGSDFIDSVATCYGRDAHLIETAPSLYEFAREIAIGFNSPEAAILRALELIDRAKSR